MLRTKYLKNNYYAQMGNTLRKTVGFLHFFVVMCLKPDKVSAFTMVSGSKNTTSHILLFRAIVHSKSVDFYIIAQQLFFYISCLSE